MSAVLPILLIFVSGYIFKRFYADSSKPLIELVIYFIFPVFIIYKVHFLEFSSDVYIVMLFAFLAFFIGLFFALIFIKLFNINKNSAAMIIISVVYGNTSFLGFAFVESFYGDYALSLAIFYDQVNMILLAMLSPVICIYGMEESEFSLQEVVKKVITFPPTVAFVIAIFSKLFVMPEVLSLYMEKISLVLVPLIMFAVGMKFKLSNIKGKEKEIGIVILISMVLIPLALFGLSIMFFTNDIAIKTAILEAAMPPMVMATIIGIKAGLDEELGMGALGIGMLLSFVTIPIVVYLI